MTNEDKAFAFANKNFEAYSHDEDPLDALRDGFLSGAEWKDSQFREYLENKRDSLEMDYHKECFEGNAYKHYLLTEIIDELFKED